MEQIAGRETRVGNKFFNPMLTARHSRYPILWVCGVGTLNN
jgi:hypothetical protein